MPRIETETVHDAFARSVEEGVVRLERSSVSLVATGLVGGLDVGVGVFALFILVEQTDQHLLGAIGFGIGFLSLTLARSELFTENFLVPINAVVAGRAPWWTVLRLWAGSGAGVIFVTHDLDEAIALADKVVVMTSSPATVKAGFDVPLERPRDVEDLKLTDDYRRIYREIWESLRVEVDKTRQGGAARV